LKAGPVWDFDWAWKDIPGCSIFDATDGSGWAYLINDCGPDVNGTGWYVRFLQDTLFANELHCRWMDFRTTMLDTTNIFHWMDSVAAYANESQQRHYDYWGHMGVATGTPEMNPPAQSYQEEVDNLKAWIRRRIVWMDANMPGNTSNCNLSGMQPAQTASPLVNAYPNPFSNSISVGIYLAQPQQVQMELVNALGQTVQLPQSRQHAGGMQVLTFATDESLPAGIYFLRVRVGDRSWTKPVSKAE
jgi:hypothetical protein